MRYWVRYLRCRTDRTIPQSTAMKRSRGADNPRDVNLHDFPDQDSVEAQLKFLITYAVLAPSVHNTQPWLFRVQDETVEIYADRSRALPVLDPTDRSLIVSCGSCVELFSHALDAHGFTWRLSVYPSLDNPDLVARFTVNARESDATIDERSIKTIRSRHTIRRGFAGLPLPSPFLEWLQTEAAHEAEGLCILEQFEQEGLILDALAEVERSRHEDIHYQRESASWMHPMRERSRDGIPLKKDEADPTQTCWARREQDDGTTTLGLISSRSTSPIAYLNAGRSLMRVLLIAASHGVNAAMTNVPQDADSMRQLLTTYAECDGEPIVLLRFGRTSRKMVTPRRPLVDVMLHPGFRR